MSRIADVWQAYRAWLEEHATGAFKNLAPPATPATLESLGAELGLALPHEALELLALNDGQISSEGCCALPGLEYLSSERILREWRMWRDLREQETEDDLASLDDHCRSVDGRVLDVYSHAGWIPLFKDGWRSDYMGLDLAPLGLGFVGQVINFGRDENAHFAAFSSLSAFLEFWLEEARAGRCRVLPAENGSSEWLEHTGGNSIEVLRAHRDPIS